MWKNGLCEDCGTFGKIDPKYRRCWRCHRGLKPYLRVSEATLKEIERSKEVTKKSPSITCSDEPKTIIMSEEPMADCTDEERRKWFG